jgi:glutamine synthetase
LVLICNIRDPVTGQNYSRDVRYVAQKAENYLVGTGTGDTAYFGPELEHFTIFPSKQTFVSAGGTSAMCQEGTSIPPRSLCDSTFTTR